jgi:hypothetical protein
MHRLKVRLPHIAIRESFLLSGKSVIGERIITPLSIAHLVLKLRISPPSVSSSKKEDENTKGTEKSDDEFLSSRKDAEDMPVGAFDGGWAHAPYWPAVCVQQVILKFLVAYTTF